MKNKDANNLLQVLLVEDSVSDISLLLESIHASGVDDFSVSVAGSMQEAVECLRDNHIDATLLDLTLPDSSGMDTIARIRNAYPGTPIVVLTGVDDENTGVEALRLGVQDYLVKGRTDGRLIKRAVRYAIERKQAEETLRSSEEQFRLAIKATNDAIWDLNLEAGELRCNQTFIANFGLPPEKTDCLSWRHSRIHPEDRQKAAGSFEAALAGDGESWMGEYRFERTDGTWADVFDRAYISRDENGKAIRVIGAILDLTERKLIEEELRRARDELEIRVNERTEQLAHTVSVLQEEAEERIKIQNALQKSETKYRELVENANSIIMRRGITGTITFFNEFAQKFFGFSEDEIIGRNVLGTIVPKTDTSGRDLKAIIANISKYPDLYQSNENENIRKNGDKVWVAWTNKALTDEQGNILELLCVGSDITEHKKIENRIRLTNYLLELFAQKTSRKEYLDAAVESIRDWSQCRCTGIRLTTSDGLIPYESCIGFSDEFLSLENTLSISRDSCACVRAITQLLEPQDMAITTGRGSFICGDAPAYISALPAGQKSRFRGNCARAGFASVAVIPIRYRQKVLGAIHLADENPGRIPPEAVEFLENMAMMIGEAVHRFDMEALLRESEERYRHLVEVSPDGIGVEIDDKIVFVNTAGARLLGCSKSDDLIGRTVVDFLHPDRRMASQKQLQYLRKRKKALPIREERFMRVDGSFIDVEVATTPLVYKNKPATQIIFRDITDRKLAEGRILADQKQLRQLTAELVLAEERERHEIAVALHDSIGPILAFAKREIGSIQKTAPPVMAETLKTVSDNITHAVKQSRTLTFDLSPPTLYTFGLEAAIEELVEHFCLEHKLGYLFHNSKEPKPLTDHVKILLYRSTREMLINIAKHAKAKSVKVAIGRDGDNIEVAVTDDGKGFNVSSLHTRSPRSKGLGLFSVRERLTHIGGSLEIDTAHGKGTKVTLYAPLKQQDNPR